MHPAQVVLIITAGLLLFVAVLLTVTLIRKKKSIRNTQRLVTDKALLYLLDRHPGGMLSPRQVAERTGLTPSAARDRLDYLTTHSLLRRGASGMRAYYELAAPVEEPAFALDLSADPFLTVADLQQIFRAYDYRVGPTDLVVATGLPWKVLQREMKHFVKRGVVEGVRVLRPGDNWKQYLLREPYLSQPTAAESRAIDAEMVEILTREKLLV